MTLWQALPWFLSCLTFVTMWLAGNRDARAWMLGLVGQVFWVAFDMHAHAFGLLPIGAGLVYIYTRNLLKWRAAR